MSLSYERLLAAIQTVAPSRIPSQLCNLALLVGAILLQRTLCLSALARAYPTPLTRRVPHPKHDLLHRLKRLERFVTNARVDPQAWQLAFVPDIVTNSAARAGSASPSIGPCSTRPCPRAAACAIKSCASPSPGGAAPSRCSNWPMTATGSPRTPARTCSNKPRLPARCRVAGGVRPVVLADCGFARAGFLAWLAQQGLDYVVRIDRGTCITAASGQRWKCGEADPVPGHNGWAAGVRYGLYHDRPRELVINLATCWRPAGGRRNGRRPQAARQPWYLATSWRSADQAAAWYRQRWWIAAVVQRQ